MATGHAQELGPQSQKTPRHRGCLVPSLRGTTVWPGLSVQCLCWRWRSGSFRTLCWGSSLVISLLILLRLHLKKQKQTKDQKTKKRITQISQIITYTRSPLNCRPSHKRDNFTYRTLKNQLSSLCVSGDIFCHLKPSADKNCFNLFIHLLILECHIFSSNLDILVSFLYILKSLRPWFCGTIFFFTFSLIEKKTYVDRKCLSFPYGFLLIFCVFYIRGWYLWRAYYLSEMFSTLERVVLLYFQDYFFQVKYHYPLLLGRVQVTQL